MRELIRLHLLETMAYGNPNFQLSFYVRCLFKFRIKYRRMALKRIIIRAYTSRRVSKTAANSHGSNANVSDLAHLLVVVTEGLQGMFQRKIKLWEYYQQQWQWNKYRVLRFVEYTIKSDKTPKLCVRKME